MAFSQATMLGDPVCTRDRGELLVTWQSSSPAGTLFQVYLDRALYWATTERRLWLPWPTTPVRIDVGTVAAGEARTDFAAALPAGPTNRAALTWTGGTWEGADIAGYLVYASPSPGAAVDYTTPAATVPFVAGPIYDGYGVGGFGEGAWGAATDATFSWTSDPLESGTWTFAVVAYDQAGNRQPAPPTATVTIAGRPAPPAAGPDGTRLAYTLGADRRPTLSWLASPSAGATPAPTSAAVLLVGGGYLLLASGAHLALTVD